MAAHAWTSADVMTEAEVVALMGRARFQRLKAMGWISPFRRGFAQDMYPRAYVRMRYEDDVRLYPGGATVSYDRKNGQFTITPGAVVRKGLGGTSGTAGGYTVEVDGRYSIQSDDRRNSPPTDTRTPGWHVCVGCRGTGSCTNCYGTGDVGAATPCQVCGGSGDCPDCAGRGMVYGRAPSPAVARAFEKLMATVRRKYGARL
jgi:hypothetical protein